MRDDSLIFFRMTLSAAERKGLRLKKVGRPVPDRRGEKAVACTIQMGLAVITAKMARSLAVQAKFSGIVDDAQQDVRT
jgi:hypothetical protein